MGSELLAGLFGSIITVVITKLLEILKADKDFKNLLKKTYFEKKINAAEIAVGEWQETLSAIGNLGVLFESLSTYLENVVNGNELFAYNNELFQMYRVKYAEKLIELEKKTCNLSKTFFLYFEIDETADSVDEFKTTFEKISYAKNLEEQCENIFKKFSNETNQELKDKLFEEMRIKLVASKEAFKQLSDCLYNTHKNLLKQLKKVHNEMKKYQ